MCPDWQKTTHVNKAQGWALFKNALQKIGNNYTKPNVDCIMCGKSFSLQQGVSEAFASDLAINDFRYNSHVSGRVDITVGKLEDVTFPQPFEDTPLVQLTPFLKPIHVEPKYTSRYGFSIVSSCKGNASGMRHLSWGAYGNRIYAESPPLWRQLVTNSKEHQYRKNYRAEVVELESAFEVFLSAYLNKNLATRLRQETIDWLLKKHSIEEQMKIGFIEVIGQTAKSMYPVEYGKWFKDVKELRDHVVHRGLEITSEQAINARKAMFNFLTAIDDSTIEQFQIQMDSIGIIGPHLSFGMAKGTGSQQAIKHGLDTTK
jgi:hypothetical protein